MALVVTVLGNGQNAFQSIEMDPVGRISCELDLTGLGAGPCDNVVDRAAVLKLGKHQRTVCGGLPYFQFMHSVADQFGTGMAVAAFEGRVRINESPFLKGRDREWDRARKKDGLEFAFREFAVLFGLFQSFLGLVQIIDSLLQLRPINRGTLIETRILDCDGGRDCQELGAPQVFTSETIRPRVADRKQAKRVMGSDQRDAQP